MRLAARGLDLSGFAILALLVTLICVAQAAYPPENDLSVTKVAQVNGIVVTEVNPGQTFNYNVTVTNNGINAAPEVVITDKLPYDVVYVGAAIYPAVPVDYTINQSGDLVYVRFDEIGAGATRYINFTVIAPTESPSTLYNIVNLRYGNDPNPANNRMTLTTYVPQIGYDQTEAAKSFEDLLHNQSQLLFQFEDLLHTVPINHQENYTFIASFEQLLRSQANLTSSFEDLLTNSSSTGWDTEYTEENRTYLLRSYEQMLYDEAFLFASFNMKLKDSWASLCNCTVPGHTQDVQTEFLASFEDLLKRQTRLYKSFDLLLNKIDITNHQDVIDFLAAYENLLRIEANLLMSFSDLLSMKYEGVGPCNETCVPPTVVVERFELNPGHKFNIVITNTCSAPINVTNITGTGGLLNSTGATYSFAGSALTDWTLVGIVGTYNNVPFTVNPGSTVTVSLDYMLIGGTVTFPDTLRYIFCVKTDCGDVCVTNDDYIMNLSPLPP